MNGLSDVRLKLHSEELQDAQRPQLYSTPAGMNRWQLMVHRWQSRHELLGLDAEQLRDIGLTPEQAQREGLKPFWRN
ncbi:DUF1127 domain-containing protein [Pseudomonas fontis]|uniref:DUF1127 domain-containing protein n=1 Tax=Pseudomonas fontis TaxID=2942633 RepID=A0ABT5NYR0_9PSED|nr:DUF1127 domain-containing protein [Pseudomonas fontis]MDD0976251.1 DUF1127 domain-containing protein [Pseudomonas fontis]MDD0993246.1 DUF1127 domain-containing protein [Pseudomonas fontis]